MFDSLMEMRKGEILLKKFKRCLKMWKRLLNDACLHGKGRMKMVSGAVHSTGATVRPALQIIKTKPGAHRISGAFLMIKGDQRYIFVIVRLILNRRASNR